MSEVLARVRFDSVLFQPVARRPLAKWLSRLFAAPMKGLNPRVCFGVAIFAVIVSIGVNALVLQRGRHPAPLFAPAAPPPLPPLPPTSAPPPAEASIPAPTAAAPTEAPPPRPAKVADAPVAPPVSDPIGDLLHSESKTDAGRLTLAAQAALIKLGYALKPDGNEGPATEQALRDFERAHGLPVSPEISPRLVKQLNQAARNPGR